MHLLHAHSSLDSRMAFLPLTAEVFQLHHNIINVFNSNIVVLSLGQKSIEIFTSVLQPQRYFKFPRFLNSRKDLVVIKLFFLQEMSVTERTFMVASTCR